MLLNKLDNIKKQAKKFSHVGIVYTVCPNLLKQTIPVKLEWAFNALLCSSVIHHSTRAFIMSDNYI